MKIIERTETLINTQKLMSSKQYECFSAFDCHFEILIVQLENMHRLK